MPWSVDISETVKKYIHGGPCYFCHFLFQNEEVLGNMNEKLIHMAYLEICLGC